MGYEISVDDRHGIASIRLARGALLSEHLEARDRVFELCRAGTVLKVLIDATDLTAAARLSTIELFDYAVSWAEFAQELPIRIAGVIPRDPAAREWWQFGETVALNRGLTAQTFEDIDAAQAWLREA